MMRLRFCDLQDGAGTAGGECVVALRQFRATIFAMTETLSIKVPVQTKARLRAVAKHRHTSPSMLLREALDTVLTGETPKGRASLYEMSRDLFDDMERGGPRDLATNPKYMEDFGR
jgi:hypothetical protein